MDKRILLATTWFALLVTGGCGSGGGGSGTAAGVGGTPTYTRAVPGGSVSVERLAAGSDGTLRFGVDLGGGLQAVAVSAWLGPDYDLPSAQAVGVPHGSRFIVALPAAPAPDANVWIQARLGDGALVEVGGPDLPALP